jgi:hypothetical protein
VDGLDHLINSKLIWKALSKFYRALEHHCLQVGPALLSILNP